MTPALQAARVSDPITHGLGLVGIVGGMLVGALAGLILIAALPVTAPALLIGLTASAAVGAVAGGGLAGHQLLDGIQRACSLPSPTTGMVGVVGSPNVRIGKLPAARVVSEMTASCNGLYALTHLPIPPLPQARIAEGSATIRINGFFAARVSSKFECGASIQSGALTVYFGGPTKRVLAVVDAEAAMLSLLGFLAKTSLAAVFILTIPLGVASLATATLFVGAFAAINYGIGLVGKRLPAGWGDVLQGAFGLIGIIGGARLASERLLEAGGREEVDGMLLPKRPVGTVEPGATKGEVPFRLANSPPALPADWPPEFNIPARHLDTFSSTPQPEVLSPGTKLYRIVGEGSSVDGPYWSLDPPPLKEAEWRAGSAVQNDWNGDGAYVEHTVGPEGMKVWSGPAAPQTSSAPGYYLPGGSNQLYVPPGQTAASPTIPTPWNP